MIKAMFLINILLLVVYSNINKVQVMDLKLHIIEGHSKHSHKHTNHDHNHNGNSHHNHDQEMMSLDAPIMGLYEFNLTEFVVSKISYSEVSKISISNFYLYLLQPEILRPPIA